MARTRSPLKRAYQALGQPNFLRWLQWPALQALLDLQGGNIVLDLGAGPMSYSIRLARHAGVRVIALDWDISVDAAVLAARHNISALRGDGQALPLADGSVDRVLMSSLMHMVPKPDRLLAECRRVLKPGGHLVLSVPNRYQTIPALMAKRRGGMLGRILRIPSDYDDLLSLLNKRFGVAGPQGYYTFDELQDLLRSEGFDIEAHKYAPGRVGSFIWELGVLAYVRFGNKAFHLLFLAFPLARLCDILTTSRSGSEHIVKAVPIHGN